MLVYEREATHGLKVEETENVVHRLSTKDVYPKTTDAASLPTLVLPSFLKCGFRGDPPENC